MYFFSKLFAKERTVMKSKTVSGLGCGNYSVLYLHVCLS